MSSTAVPSACPPRLSGGRALLAACWLGLPGAAAMAAEPVAELRQATVALVAELQAQRSAQPALELELVSAADELLIRDVSLHLDGAVPVRYRYSEAQAEALRHGARQLLRLPQAAGASLLRVELAARRVGAHPADPRVHASLEQALDGAATGLLQLRLQPQNFGREPQLLLSAADAGDPQRRAQFLLASARPYAAAASGAPADPASSASPVEAYNQAVVQLQGDAAAAGEAALAALGSGEPQDEAGRALRDRANLTLGYHLLRRRAIEQARPAFARVRSPGPYGTRALLGFGWSFLLPAGGTPEATASLPAALLWAAAGEEQSSLRRERPFRYLHSVATGGSRAEDLRRALIPWTELLGRDPTDPAVQEGLVAIPYALGHLGAHEQALRYTERAIEQLEIGRGRLDAAIAHAGNGALLGLLRERFVETDAHDGWRRTLADLPYADDSAYLAALFERDDVLAALESYRDLLELVAVLEAEGAADGGAPPALAARHAALQATLAAAATREGAQLQALALAALRAQRQRTEIYLAEARLALARFHDRPLEGEA